jgi:hypothetical protein
MLDPEMKEAADPIREKNSSSYRYTLMALSEISRRYHRHLVLMF